MSPMPVIHSIYLDLDDVCNTLAPYVLAEFGCPVKPTNYNQYPAEFGYAAHEVVNHYTGSDYTWEQFWPTLPQTLWASVPTTDFFLWLLDTCRALVGEKSVFLATYPVLSAACAAGKMEWIQAFCPPWLRGQFFITPHKDRLGEPGALLIDDSQTNITNFKKRHGRGILVPRPWNTWRGRDPRSHITAQLKHFQFTTQEPR